MHNFFYHSNSCFHLLLHLQKPTDLFLDRIRQAGYDELQIRNQLTIAGSRFFPEFVSDMESLLCRLNESPSSITSEANGNLRITLKVDLNAFPNGAGTNAVIPLEKLTDIQKESVFPQRNRGYEIQHLKVEKMPVTKHFMVIVKAKKKGYTFITAFPGDSSMPMPHHGMKPSLFQGCKEFWEKHVILVQE